MRKIFFNKLFIEGFGSVQAQLFFELGRGGIWMVNGMNGGGKTTIFSAFLWALFKVNLKEVLNANVSTWEENRFDTFRGTRVIVQFDVENASYMVARHLEFKGTTKGLKGGSKLMLFKKPLDLERDFEGSDLVGDTLHQEDMQKYISDVLNLDSKMFLNSVLFGQRMKRLVEVDSVEKRNLFEKLFELDFIQRARDNGKSLKDKLSNDKNDIEIELSKCETMLIDMKDRYVFNKKLLDEFETNKTWKLNISNKELSEISKKYKIQMEELEGLKKNILIFSDEKLNSLRNLYAKGQDEQADINREIKDLEYRIKGFEIEMERANINLKKLNQELENVEEQCPYCEGDLPEKKIVKVKNEIKSRIKVEKEVLSTLNEKLNGLPKNLIGLKKELEKKSKDVSVLSEKVLDLKKAQKDMEEYKNNVLKLSTSTAVLEERLKGVKERYEEIKNSKPPTIDLTGDHENILKQEKLEKKLIKKVEVIDNELQSVNWWLTKGFASGGVKAFVFNAMLIKLNSYIEKYAQRLGVYVKFSVDLSKASKPFITKCFKGGKEIDYKELSGGEKQRIDIALAFAMHDLISYSSKVNLLIMDECFEGLDIEGVETAFDLIRIKSGDQKTVFVISHAIIIDALNSKRIEVQKDETGNSYVA